VVIAIIPSATLSHAMGTSVSLFASLHRVRRLIPIRSVATRVVIFTKSGRRGKSWTCP